MKFKKFIHKDVAKDGRCKSGGAVVTEGKVIIIKGHCDLKGCNCSNGYFLTIAIPLKNKKVEGICVQFDNFKEMKQTINLD